MSQRKVTLSVKVDDGAELGVALELFEAFWNSRYILIIDELSVDGKPAYEDVRRVYGEKVRASRPLLSVDSARRCEQVERGER